MRSGVRVSWFARLDTPPALLGRRATRTGAAQRNAGHRGRIVARTRLNPQEGPTVATRWQTSSAPLDPDLVLGRLRGEERQQPGALVGQVRRLALRERPDRPKDQRGRSASPLPLDPPRPGDEPV